MPVVDVGQIIYVLDQKRHSLIPGCVYERVVSKTIDGENTHHVVRFSNDKGIILEKLTTPWFVDIDSAKEFLLNEAKQLIDSVASRASEQAAENFPEQLSVTAQFNSAMIESVSRPADPSAIKESQANLKVDLGDGLTGNLHLPEEFLNEDITG